MTAAMPAPMPTDLPNWVPATVATYLLHTECGMPLRALARSQDVHPSTVLRQVRRLENRRDDPLFDDALRQITKRYLTQGPTNQHGDALMRNGDNFKYIKKLDPAECDAALTLRQRAEVEQIRVLRRLCESGAVLAVAADLDNAVVVRDSPDGSTARTATVNRDVAHAMALNDWIASDDPTARVVRYKVTQAGRVALREILARAENRARGMAESAAGFDHKPTEADLAAIPDDIANRYRAAPPESPLVGLARRRDKDGKPFLNRDLVQAGEQLREDFELAQMQPNVSHDWAVFLKGPLDVGPLNGGTDHDDRAGDARSRLAAALAYLGPGLGDAALRCCCYLEGLEHIEKRMGWSARSGKIVLRIALQRLKLHYAQTQGLFRPRIG